MYFQTSPMLALWASLAFAPSIKAQAPLGGHATRFWDCCKLACSWPRFTSVVNQPVKICGKDQAPITDYSATSGCIGGPAYSCPDMVPQVISPQLALGFAAVVVAGETDNDWCCACYKITFTSGPAQGQQMIVQGVSTGGDMGSDQFDILIPGAGGGLFEGCHNQYGAPSGGWGQQWGGILDRSGCSAVPSFFQAACQFRFDWMKGADNPTVSYEKLSTCPKALTDISGCIRNGQTPTNDYAGAGSQGALPQGGNSMGVAAGSSSPAAGANPTSPAMNNYTPPPAGQNTPPPNSPAGSPTSPPPIVNTPPPVVNTPPPVVNTPPPVVNTPPPVVNTPPPSVNTPPPTGGSLPLGGGTDGDLPFWAVGPAWNGMPRYTVPGIGAAARAGNINLGGQATTPPPASATTPGIQRPYNFLAVNPSPSPSATEGPDDECDAE